MAAELTLLFAFVLHSKITWHGRGALGGYGTDRKPPKTSAGQSKSSEGTITFSDLEEGMAFYSALGDDPSLAELGAARGGSCWCFTPCRA